MNEPTTQSPFVISALDGLFPGAPTLAEFWRRVLQTDGPAAQPLVERWSANRLRDLATDPLGDPLRKARGYTLAPSEPATTSDARSGRQVRLAQGLLDRFVAEMEGPWQPQRTGLALATSWSDESAFLCGTEHGADYQGALGPSEQLAALSSRLRLRGPRFAVDTACSSTLYALSNAINAIDANQCDAMIVLALNAFLPANLYLGFGQLGALSARGRLQAFAEGADGIVPGEAVVALLVEREADALSAGRRPLARIRGVGLSCDGRDGSAFAPSAAGQDRAYRRSHSGDQPIPVHYVEGHGTGTPVGDKVELSSLRSFYARSADHGPIYLGSSKALFGHSLAAAGGVSLAKALCILRSRILPPHPVDAPSPHLDAEAFALPDSPFQWQGSGPLRVAVSAFGFGGSNGHVVLEEFVSPDLGEAEDSRRRTPGVFHLQLEVRDVDGALSGGFDLSAFRDGLTEPGSATRPPIRYPAGRVGCHDGSSLSGHFFHGTTTIEAKGLGMGPRPLSALDPFKALTTHRVRRLRDRLNVPRERTSFVMCGNLGGERFGNTYRAVEAFFDNGSALPTLQVEGVPTELPSFQSAYPAMLNDLQGFHCTLSGDSGLLIDALLQSDAWLTGECDLLLLGAGTCISLPSTHAKLEAHGTQDLLHGEGLGLLALARMEAKLSPGALGSIDAIVVSSAASTAEQAAAAAGLKAKYDVMRCTLSVPRSGADVGTAQAMTGFLSEACGIESLIGAFFRQSGSHVVVEFVRDGIPEAWCFITVAQSAKVHAEPEISIPARLCFSEPTSTTGSTAASRESQLEKGLAHARASGMARVAVAHMSLLEAVLRSERLSHGAKHTPIPRMLGAPRRAPSNVCLRRAKYEEGMLRSQVWVREDHPFFFDHPLDHVPGIMLLESALQLCEVGLDALGLNEVFLRKLSIHFKRYAEKEVPIEITVPMRGISRRGGSTCVTMRQGHEEICSFDLVFGQPPSRVGGGAPSGTSHAPAEQRLLHKHHRDNVAITELLTDNSAPRGVCVKTLPLAPDHALEDGGRSMLFFLESARQAYTLIAHEVKGIPLGSPMNLLKLEFELVRPIPAGQLTLLPAFDPKPWRGAVQTGDATIALMGAAGAVGKAHIRAMALSPAFYEQQRTAAAS